MYRYVRIFYQYIQVIYQQLNDAQIRIRSTFYQPLFVVMDSHGYRINNIAGVPAL